MACQSIWCCRAAFSFGRIRLKCGPAPERFGPFLPPNKMVSKSLRNRIRAGATAQSAKPREPILERPRSYKLLLLNCPNGIATEDVVAHYQEHMGHCAVDQVKWFQNACGDFIGEGLRLYLL